jgi:hypothetical protein
MWSYETTPHSACRMCMCDIAGAITQLFGTLKGDMHPHEQILNTTRSERKCQHAECHTFRHYANPTITSLTCFQLQNLCKPDTNFTEGFENRVLRRIFWSKRDEVTGGWRKLHNEELHNLYSSRSIIIMIKSRRMRWAGHIARMGRKLMLIAYWWKTRRKENTRKTKT